MISAYRTDAIREAEEPLLAADGPGCDVIHAGGGPDDSVAVALRTQRMLGPERPGQSRPPVGVVEGGRRLAWPVLVRVSLRPRRVPR